MLANKTSKWIQRLLPACNGDMRHAKRELEWLKEKVTDDASKPIYSLSKQEEEQLETFITQRTDQHKPLQYILGTQPFCELEIVTRPPTLIPRWETEEWTFKVIDLLRKQLKSTRKPLRILDLCTGSGCISLALAKHLPQNSVHITGLDISKEAIALSNHNLQVHSASLRNPVEFNLGDLFKLDMKQTEVNLIVSNPPYITEKEYDALDPDVKDWEDPRALVAQDEGTGIHQQIIRMAKHCRPLTQGPYLFMEMGVNQSDRLKKYMLQHGFQNVDIWKDLAERDRVITGY